MKKIEQVYKSKVTFQILKILNNEFRLRKIHNIFFPKSNIAAKITLLLMFLIVKICSAQSDRLEIPFQKHIGIGSSNGGIRVTYLDSSTKFKGIPQGIDDYIIKFISFTYKIPENISGNIYQSKVYFLIGNKSDSIIIVPDINSNFDFSDERVMLYSKIKRDISLPYINIPVTYKQFHFIYTIQPYPYPTIYKYANELEQKYFLVIKQFQFATSDTAINGDSIYAVNLAVNPFVKDLGDIEFAIKDSQKKLTHYYMHDYFSSEGVRYIFDSVTASLDTLFLIKKDSSIVQSGYQDGLNLQPFEVKDIEGNELRLPIEEKFTLIDFWGTWCVPCTELTPQLKKLSKNFESHLRIVSIAYDENLQRVKNYVHKKKLLWHQVFEAIKGDHPVISNFNITTYPTFLLIDPDGKIIIRGEGKEALQKIELFLRNNSK